MSDDTIQNTEAQAVDGTAQPSLQLSDLVLALQTIQAMAQRGTIRADEMTTVGGLHDRLFAFLEAQGVIKRQPTTQTGDANA